MPATVRYDEQYCPIARALDALGDRWTLLILRELLIADQRFTDLRRHLPGIAPTVLTQRLRTMEEQGLVTTREASPSSSRSMYSVTERGRTAVPVLTALAKWGMPLLEEPVEGQPLRPWPVVFMSVGAYYDPPAAAGVDERYRFRFGDDVEVTLSSLTGSRSRSPQADVVFESEPRLWIDIRQGRLTLAEARRRKLVRWTGRAASVANFRRIFQVP
jgi:DNA-binding HxlR family transcriptional regulator